MLRFPSYSTAYYKTFVNTWDDDDEDLFLNHVKRYCHAFRPDSGIAFHETDRSVLHLLHSCSGGKSLTLSLLYYSYSRSSITKSAAARQTPSPTPPPATSTRSPDTFIEVGVFATRNFKKGEIVNLRGGVADLSEEEDDKMREGGGRSDFSVLWSARKKCFGLLLGPARFVNHDCRNNVQFHLTGSNMSFKVMEDIKADEELFTHYGDHYFDKDNAACLCATCQKCVKLLQHTSLR
ncbi:hypothetical protein BCR35DRAFT_262388 [Leucosporidium creatinivorum]|uniref:SET domain-containing protein n=1 Tax=Leucosporidium creatinivorum TaxID=106004 RepID=A0A1Y2G168_9BASI|nr:hypothetical protein BCR35DRAFT_262388 [Leucosporidium creatinivorum]